MQTALEKGIENAIMITDQLLRAEYIERGINMWVNNVNDKGRSFNLWRQLVWQLRSLPLADVLLCLSAIMPLIKDIAEPETLVNVAEVLGIRG